jgi:hypothetical protein
MIEVREPITANYEIVMDDVSDMIFYVNLSAPRFLIVFLDRGRWCTSGHAALAVMQRNLVVI